MEVALLNDEGTVLENAKSDAEGRYSFPVKENMEYAVRARSAGHYDGLVHLSTENIGQRQIVARDAHLLPDAGIWLRGAVKYKDKLGFVEGVKVSVVNLSSFFSEVRTTEAGGDFLFRMQPNEEFGVTLEKSAYFTMSVLVNTAGMKQGIIELGQVQELALERMEVGKPLPLKYITWSGDETGCLSPTAKAQLDQLADRMQVNPTLNIEVGVHANTNRAAGPALKLTQDRAKMIDTYLRTRGSPETGPSHGEGLRHQQANKSLRSRSGMHGSTACRERAGGIHGHRRHRFVTALSSIPKQM